MNKAVGGYILIDFNELNFTNTESSQSVAGLYNRLKEAINLGKSVIAVNCKIGNVKSTPISMAVADYNQTTVIALSNTLSIYVDNADKVVIESSGGGGSDDNTLRIDLGGFDIQKTGHESPTKYIEGIYETVTQAFLSGKLVVFYNFKNTDEECVYGASVYSAHKTNYGIYGYVGNTYLIIESNDYITFD